MFLRSRTVLIFLSLSFASSVTALAQTVPTPTPAAKPEAAISAVTKADLKNLTAEQVVETSIVFYSLGGGRPLLNQIRKSTIERGKSNYTDATGKIEQAVYQKFVLRAETLDKEKIRLDQQFPNAKYSLVLNDEKIYGIYNNTVFAPREDAARGFENQTAHGLDAYLRYKENGSTIELGPREKLLGVDYYLIDVTDKQKRKTRFYVSVKYFKVMMLTYDDAGVEYRRKFYDYNYAQGTLVPFRTVLWADKKIVEETEIDTVTFGQKVDEDLFKSGS